MWFWVYAFMFAYEGWHFANGCGENASIRRSWPRYWWLLGPLYLFLSAMIAGMYTVSLFMLNTLVREIF